MNVLNPQRFPKPFSRAIRFTRKPVPLRAMLVSAGVETRSQEPYDWHGLHRGNSEFALLQVTLSGEGRLRYEGRVMEVQPGSVMILHFPHDNRYWLPPGGTWEFFYICLNGAEVMQHWRRFILQAGPLLPLDQDSETVRAGFGICRKCANNEIRTAWEASTLAYGLAMSLATDVEGVVREQARHTIGLIADKRLQAARLYANTHFQKPIGVADLVQQSGFSRSHFSRLFHTRFGESPQEYLTGLRLRRAAKLLLESCEPIAAIAVVSGFSDANYFSRVFRAAYGITPGAYRRGGFVSMDQPGSKD